MRLRGIKKLPDIANINCEEQKRIKKDKKYAYTYTHI